MRSAAVRVLQKHFSIAIAARMLGLSIAAISIAAVTRQSVQAQQVGAQTIVLWSANVPPSNIHGMWTQWPDATAAGQVALLNPNAGVKKITPALAAPTNYFEIAFNADAGVPYHLWVRLRAWNDRLANDSIHVQFSDSVDASGAPVARIGTTESAEVILQDGPNGGPLSSWGWADNGWGAPGAPLSFAASGSHVIRIQQREDGAIVDQIVLSADTFAATPPGPRLDDATVLAWTDGTPVPAPAATGTIVLRSANIPASSVFGNWSPIADPTAAGGTALDNPDAGQTTIDPALASPTNYFETAFTATAGVPYHVWLRMRAESDSLSNDSVHVQFSDSLDPDGVPVARIGTTSSAVFVLQAGPSGPAPHGWGWTDNSWTAFGSNILFESTGSHLLRIQQREDGAVVDQIVISPDAYLTSAPGLRRDDSTILDATSGGGTGNQPPTVSLTSPADGATFTAPATVTLTASAGDADGTVQKVDFYAGSTLVGTSSSAPYSFAWSAVAAGTYTLKAVATDNAGAQTSSATVSITVNAAPPPSTYTVEFTASTDNDTDVTSYLLEVFAAGADPNTAVAIASIDMGKPTPDANQQIAVDETTFLSALPSGTYVVTVSAIGPGGQARSAPYTFTK
jgi:hypothetical protein